MTDHIGDAAEAMERIEDKLENTLALLNSVQADVDLLQNTVTENPRVETYSGVVFTNKVSDGLWGVAYSLDVIDRNLDDVLNQIQIELGEIGR